MILSGGKKCDCALIVNFWLQTARRYRRGLGADVTISSKPAVLDAAYGNHPVSFQIFLRHRDNAREKLGHS